MGSSVAHYAALVVAERPIEQHKEYLEKLEEEEEDEELLRAVRVDSGASAAIAELMTEDDLAAEAEYHRQIRSRWSAWQLRDFFPT